MSDPMRVQRLKLAPDPPQTQHLARLVRYHLFVSRKLSEQVVPAETVPADAVETAKAVTRGETLENMIRYSIKVRIESRPRRAHTYIYASAGCNEIPTQHAPGPH